MVSHLELSIRIASQQTAEHITESMLLISTVHCYSMIIGFITCIRWACPHYTHAALHRQQTLCMPAYDCKLCPSNYPLLCNSLVKMLTVINYQQQLTQYVQWFIQFHCYQPFESLAPIVNLILVVQLQVYRPRWCGHVQAEMQAQLIRRLSQPTHLPPLAKRTTPLNTCCPGQSRFKAKP